LKLKELGEVGGGLDYGSVGSAVKRFEQRLMKVPALAKVVSRAHRTLREIKMQNA
jgi:hypothetical protein